MRTQDAPRRSGVDAQAQLARLAPVLIAVVGGVGSSLLFWSLRSGEMSSVRAGLEQEATECIARTSRELDVNLEPLYSTVALFDSSQLVEPEEFTTFTARMLERARALRAIVWIERLRDAPDGPFVVRYGSGPEVGMLQLGDGLQSHLGEAGGTSLAVSAPFPVKGAPRVLTTLPVRDSSGNLQGLVGGLLDVGRLWSLAEKSRSTDLTLFAEDVTSEPIALHAAEPRDGEFLFGRELELGGRKWLFGSTVPSDLVSGRTTWMPWIAFVFGLLATGLLAATVVSVTSRARIQALVERRTNEVKAAYDTLAHEAQQRLQAGIETQLVERRLREIIDLVPDMIYVKDWYGRFLLANEATAEALGTTVRELTASAEVDMNTDVTEPDETLREERLLMESELSSVIRAIPFVDAAGKRHIMRTVKIPCTAFDQSARALLCVATDITEQKHAEDVLRSQNRILSLLARGADPNEVLSDLVDAAEEIVQGMRCSVLVVSTDHEHLCHGSAPSLPAFYNEAVDGLAIGPEVGSCGAAAHSGERVVVEDVLTHPNWAPYRELAQRAKIRACWSQPIRAADGEILGTFAMYYAEPRAPEHYEEELIESMAHLAGIAIERGRLESRS